MVSFTGHAAPNDRDSDDDLDARCARIRQKFLDGIEETLNELAQPDVQRSAIVDVVWAQSAPLICRQVTCRRAKRCRRNPCTVPLAAAAATDDQSVGR